MHNKYKQHGFTAFELIGALVVLTFIIIITNKIMDNMLKTREYNQLADQSNNFSKVAAKYIEANYRGLVESTTTGNDLVIPYTVISDYKPNNLTEFTKSQQTPCIYITSDTNSRLMSSIRAYLIFGNTKSTSGVFSQLEAASIVNIIGNYAGILVSKDGKYIFTGGIENDLNLSTTTINNIISGCGFIRPLPRYTLIIDLSKNKLLFASIKGDIDKQSSANDPELNDPSLKKSSVTPMQTNIYLDNIYKESTTQIPAQHVYRALDYGKSNISGGGRIQIKSDASTGPTAINSKLAINNAGLQSGLIEPISHVINAGSSCNAVELGKILQDMSSVTINSQIQCSYNPSYCPGNGYCYLPIKSTTFEYQFDTAKASYSCPIGTVVDGNQPAGNIIDVTCPVISGWNRTQTLHGEGIPDSCYKGITGMTFCQGYQAVCTYDKGIQIVAALKKLRCTNSTAIFTIDNYIP
jgi:hypothetical protein